MERVVGYTLPRSDGEYEIETSIGSSKVEMILLFVLSIAERWKTSLVTAALPLGVLANAKKVVGSNLLAWKTRLVEVAETEGGIESSILLFDTVEVAVLEAAMAVLVVMGAWLVQPPVLVV
jgi:hypothetical protein